MCMSELLCLQPDLSLPAAGHDCPGLLLLGFSKVNYSQCLIYVLLTPILLLSLNITMLKKDLYNLKCSGEKKKKEEMKPQLY